MAHKNEIRNISFILIHFMKKKDFQTIALTALSLNKEISECKDYKTQKRSC